MNGDSTITITLLIAILGVFLSLANTVFNIVKASKKDTKSEAAEMTSLIIKLEVIQDNIKDIKADMASVKNDNRVFRDRTIALEQSDRATQRRLEKLEERS